MIILKGCLILTGRYKGVTVMTDEQRTEERPPEITGILSEGLKVVVPSSEEVEYLKSREYGIVVGEEVMLEPVEALYLVKRGILKVKDQEGKTLGFEEYLLKIAEKDGDIWIKLEVYSDLRKRGLQVKPGYAEGLVFLLDRKKKGKVKGYMVYVFREGVKIGFPELEKAFTRAIESGREPVVAIVDKEGNVSYYVMSKMM